MNKVQAGLLRSALAASRKSYSPYSDFPVGAALMADGGKVFTGCNVENASYGLTVCAERVAIMKAVSEGHRKFKALAVVGGRDKAVPPCGACLQVLAEFCDPDLPIFLAPLNKPNQVVALSLETLLPHAFRLNTKH